MSIWDKAQDIPEYSDLAEPQHFRNTMTFQDEQGDLSSYDPFDRETGQTNPLYAEDVNNPMSPNFRMDMHGGDWGNFLRWGNDGMGEGIERGQFGQDAASELFNLRGEDWDNYEDSDTWLEHESMDPRRQESFEPFGTTGGYTDPNDPRALYYRGAGHPGDPGYGETQYPNINDAFQRAVGRLQDTPLGDAMNNMYTPERKMNIPSVEDYGSTMGKY